VTLPETDDLRAFIEVVAQGTFTAAAQRLHTSQPALSRRIARLEHQIGGILFERENRREPLLTALGQILLPYAEKALGDLDEFALAAKEQTRGETGELVVAIADGLVDACLPHLVRHARQRLPGIRIRVREIPSGDVPDVILEHQAELGLLTSEFRNPDIDGVTYGMVQHMAMGLPAYLGQSTEGVEWEHVAKLPLSDPPSDHRGPRAREPGSSPGHGQSGTRRGHSGRIASPQRDLLPTDRGRGRTATVAGGIGLAS
jgi:DNA-binding transcriptional LysR family regulator